MTDEMGSPVAVTRDGRRGARIRYSDTGEVAPKLTRLQQVYINWHAHDILLSENSIFVRPRPDYMF